MRFLPIKLLKLSTRVRKCEKEMNTFARFENKADQWINNKIKT